MPVVRRPISANLGLNLNPDFIIPFVQKPLPFLFKAYNHQIVDRKNYTGFLSLKLSNLKSDLTQTLGYPNPALNSPAQRISILASLVFGAIFEIVQIFILNMTWKHVVIS